MRSNIQFFYDTFMVVISWLALIVNVWCYRKSHKKYKKYETAMISMRQFQEIIYDQAILYANQYGLFGQANFNHWMWSTLNTIEKECEAHGL